MFENLTYQSFYDPASAQVLLGAILAQPSLLPNALRAPAGELSPRLTPDDFEPDLHRPIWLAFLELDRLFLRGGINLLAGEITSGKTFLALDLVISVAAGLPAWDHRPCAAGPVLYFCQDTGPRTIQRRLLSLCAGRGLSPPPALLFEFSFLRLADAEGLEYLAAQVGRHHAVLVILDALARYLPGADENSAATVGPVLPSTPDITVSRLGRCKIYTAAPPD